MSVTNGPVSCQMDLVPISKHDAVDTWLWILCKF